MSDTERSWAGAQDIATAPQDGTFIYAFDGEWWRLINWHDKADGFGEAGWRHMGWHAVQPILWYPRNEEYEAMLDNFMKGMRPKS